MKEFWDSFKQKTTNWYNQDRIRAIGLLLMGVGIGALLYALLSLF